MSKFYRITFPDSTQNVNPEPIYLKSTSQLIAFLKAYTELCIDEMDKIQIEFLEFSDATTALESGGWI